MASVSEQIKKQERDKAAYEKCITDLGYDASTDSRLAELEQKLEESKQLLAVTRSPEDQGHHLHVKLKRIEKLQEKDSAIIRRAAEDEDEAEERRLVATARWNRRADAAAKIRTELGKLRL